MDTIRILVADDEAFIRHVVEMKLKKAGFEVVAVSDGEEALDQMEEFDPHLIMTDYQMPVMSGYEMSVALKERGSVVPIVMVTARGHMLSEDDLEKTNIRAMMCKPFAPREMLQVIRSVLEDAGLWSDESRGEAA